MNPFLLGGAIGASAMYFLDPQSGRRRRARTRDQLVHARRRLSEARSVTARDLSHRAQGIAAGTRRLWRAERVSDDVLVGRVRSALGRTVSHPHAIEVAAGDGHVMLQGPVLAREVAPLLRAVRRVPGVRSVADHLTAHEEAGSVSSLQGGVPRRGHRFELMQDNWSPAARLVAGIVGAGMIAAALRARAGMCALLGAGGSALLARAATNRDLASLAGYGRRGITVHKTMNLDAPVERVFELWRDCERFPSFMHNVRDVQRVGENVWRWVVAGPGGVPLHWVAEVTAMEPGRFLRWRSTGDSEVRHGGEVRFEENGHGSSAPTPRARWTPTCCA
jgi:uncharacterized membrane protein